MSMLRKAILGALLILYALALASSVFRIAYRVRHQGRWHDDNLSGLSALVGLASFMLLLYLLVTEPLLKPIHYNVNISIFLFILWNSRSCLAMTTGRVYKLKFMKGIYKRQFLWLSIMLSALGIIFSAASIGVCVRVCNSLKDCFCHLPRTFSIVAFISDSIAELALVGLNAYMLSGFSSPFDWRRRLLAFGLLSSLCTLAVNTTFWILYIVKSPENFFLFLCLSNATVVVSILVSNLSVIIGAAARRIFPKNQDPPKPAIALNSLSPLPSFQDYAA